MTRFLLTFAIHFDDEWTSLKTSCRVADRKAAEVKAAELANGLTQVFGSPVSFVIRKSRDQS